jgi:lysyl-tRNA synthetase class 2
LSELKDAAHRVGINLDLGDDRLAYIDLLFSHMVEPSLGFDTPVFLTDFHQNWHHWRKLKLMKMVS